MSGARQRGIVVYGSPRDRDTVIQVKLYNHGYHPLADSPGEVYLAQLVRCPGRKGQEKVSRWKTRRAAIATTQFIRSEILKMCTITNFV